MTTSNIITFPYAMKPQDILPTAHASPDTSATMVSLVKAAPFTAETEAELHAAAIVRASIRFARRKGVSLDSLPTQLRLWLLRECDRGDPACLVVRDWLNGNRKYISCEIATSVGLLAEGEGA